MATWTRPSGREAPATTRTATASVPSSPASRRIRVARGSRGGRPPRGRPWGCRPPGGEPGEEAPGCRPPGGGAPGCRPPGGGAPGRNLGACRPPGAGADDRDRAAGVALRASHARRALLRTAIATSATTTPAAAANATAGGSVTLASGTTAARRTMPIIRPSTSAPGMPMTGATNAGAPSATSAPPARAAVPVAIARGTRGTTARFEIGERGATRPKARRIRGRVAAWAASETPRPSRIQRGSHPARRSRTAVTGTDQAMRPAVAAAESCSPTSIAFAGLATTRPATAQPSAAAADPGRPVSRARSATPVIAAARTTDADAPARTVYATIATRITPDRVRRARPARRAPTSPATIAMFQPEMATTCERPVAVNAAARSRSTRSRSPTRIPAASPAAGSGSARARELPAARRVRSSSPAASAARATSSSVPDRSVPTTPVRRRKSP